MKAIKRIAMMAALGAITLTSNAQLLWKVSGNGIHGDTYIFGTHHIAPVSMLDKVSGLDEALKSADVVFGEIDMSSMADPMAAQQAMMVSAMAPADSTLTRVLTAAQVDSLNNLLGKYTNGMLSAAQLDMFKPALVSTQIAMMQSMALFPEFNANEQLDGTIQNRARELDKPIRGFETLEEQMGILFGGSIADQAKGLMKTVSEEEKGIELAKKLADYYQAQNIEGLTEIFADQANMDEESIRRLIVDRNNKWVKTMEMTMPVQSMFIAVGAGHLVGKDGLINQLREAGYSVEPVK